MLLPLEPARACGRLDLLHVALMADRRARAPAGSPRRRQTRAGGRAARARRCALAPEHAAERLVHEREPPFGIAAQDDVGLIVEQIAIARLVLADLPLQVLELLQAPLEPVADAHEALELAGRDRDRAGRALRTRGRAPSQQRSMSAASLSAGPEGIRSLDTLDARSIIVDAFGGHATTPALRNAYRDAHSWPGRR